MAEEQQASAEATQDIVVRCTKCGETFAPDLKLKKDPWFCTHCEAKNPNLRRLYRGVADVFGLGLLLTFIFLAVNISALGLLALPTAISIFWMVFLVFSIFRIYRARAPWLDRVARTLIWLVFALAFTLNVALPLALRGREAVLGAVGRLIVYSVVFAYVLWLLKVTRRAMVARVREP